MNSIYLRMIYPCCCVATALLLLLPNESATEPKRLDSILQAIPKERKAEINSYLNKIGLENVVASASPYSNQYDPLYRSIDVFNSEFDRRVDHFSRQGKELNKQQLSNRKQRFESYEKIGLGILDSIGYKIPGCLSLKLDTFEFQKVGKDPSEIMKGHGSFVYREYCGPIPIEGATAAISFLDGKVWKVVFRTVAPILPHVTAVSPTLSMQEAIRSYLASKPIKITDTPTGGLCYKVDIKNAINLILCWCVNFPAMSDSRDVWIDATTGKVVFELSTVREAYISGTIRGGRYGLSEYPSLTKDSGIPKARAWVSSEYFAHTNQIGGYLIDGLSVGTNYKVQNDMLNDRIKIVWPVGMQLPVVEVNNLPSSSYSTANFNWNNYSAETSLFYYMNIIGQFYADNWNNIYLTWRDPKSSSSKIVMANASNYNFGQALNGNCVSVNNEGAKYGMVIYHEYAHLMGEFYWGKWGLRSTEEIAIDEAVADFVATRAAGSTVLYGSGYGGFPNRNINNTLTYGITGSAHHISQVLSGAFYELVKIIGPTKLNNILYDAIENMSTNETRPFTFSTTLYYLLIQDYTKFGGGNHRTGQKPIHGESICTAFARKGIQCNICSSSSSVYSYQQR